MSSSLLIRAAIEQLNRKAFSIPTQENKVTQSETLNESVDDIINLLTEELSDKHRKIISNMPDTDKWVSSDHDKVFGRGVNNQEIPYSREGEQKITSENYQNQIKIGGWGTENHHQWVFGHLHRKGYKVTDYVGGYAKNANDENSREEKIGKILSKTGADSVPTNIMSKPKYKMTQQEDGSFTHARDSRGKKIVESEGKPLSVSQTFANDPIRAAKKDVRLVVTRSKEGVAGMSTGKGWKSCMNLDDGCNRHYVPHDVHQGTLTAYLVRKEDTNFDSPVGRVNLKQFKNDDGHRIWRPEDQVYGAMPKAALHAIKNWSETQYPHKEDTIYSKHSSLYNDDGKANIVTGNPEFSKFHAHVRDQVENIVNSTRERNEEFYIKHGFPDGDEDPQDNVNRFLESLPNHVKSHLSIHHGLTTEDDPSEKYESDKDYDDYIGEWAHSNSRYQNMDRLSDKDLMTHLNTAEEASDRGRMYDSATLSHATETHAKLIHEAMKRNNQDIKDRVISHMVNNHDHPDNKDWYANMNDEDSHRVPYMHELTQNSNLLHKLYHVGKEGSIPNLIPDINDMSKESGHKFAHAIGKYGDDDFIKEIVNKDYHYHAHHENGDHHIIAGFHKGLNERPDGEEMQHKLIGELNLGPGSAEHGEVKPVTPYDVNQLKHVGKPSFTHHEDGIDHPGQNGLYANVAYYTSHPSVHAVLKSRHDTQTPEIQKDLRDNIHGLGR